MPPKRKAAAKASTAWDAGDAEEVNGPQPEERPAKRARGRPKSTDSKPAAQSKSGAAAPSSDAESQDTAPKKKKGKPRGTNGGSHQSSDAAEPSDKEEQPKRRRGPRQQKAMAESKDDADVSAAEAKAPENSAPKQSKAAKPAKSAAVRGRKKADTDEQLKNDGEFQYTPVASRQMKSAEKPTEEAEPTMQGGGTEYEANDTIPESVRDAPDVVEESILPDERPIRRSVSASPSKITLRRQSNFRASLSPQKRLTFGASDEAKANTEPELRRRLGDLTRKYDTLENRYRNLREIGIVEANNNMEKLRKQCEAITTASDNLVKSLKEELEAQRTLVQRTRDFEKQLNERDEEVVQLKSQAEDSTKQVSSAQTEVKTLQTKLSAARNTAASLEMAGATKAPGGAIKGGANRGTAAANAEAAQAAQYAQLKEDLYSDLTGIIIRDVKKREDDTLYDCIQTGSNGTLHFKLLVPHVSSANFENAEFQYIPLLDENRDRGLLEILPEYLTVDITFARHQASKFYARVIDTLTRRRGSSGAGSA